MMAEISIRENYIDWVRENVVTLFDKEGIKMTDNAVNLFAWSMQMQTDEEVMDGNQLFNRASKIADRRLIDYYRDHYGEKDMNFNRAFHVLSDWGFVLKYPWTQTGNDFDTVV